MWSWLKRIFGKSDDTDVEWPCLARYTVYGIPCKICGQVLKDGDVIVRFDTLRGPRGASIPDRTKVDEHAVLAHVECLVIIEGKPRAHHRPHPRSIVLSQGEYDDWLRDGLDPWSFGPIDVDE